MPNSSSVTVAGLRVGVPGETSASVGRTAATPKAAPHQGRWVTCSTCGATGDGSCASCEGSGVVVIALEQPKPPGPAPREAPSAAIKKAPAKKTTARKAAANVAAIPVETIEQGQLVWWSKADLLDPEEADDEDHWWSVPEGIWRKVNSVSAETTRHGEPVLVIEYASSHHSGDDFDERTYRPGTVLQTKPATYRTHKVGSTLKVGDHIKIGESEWIVHADGLEER